MSPREVLADLLIDVVDRELTRITDGPSLDIDHARIGEVEAELFELRLSQMLLSVARSGVDEGAGAGR